MNRSSNMADTTTGHDWLVRFAHCPAVDQLCEAAADRKRTVVQGSVGSSTALLAGALAQRTGRVVLLVVAHLDEADDALEDLELFTAAGMSVDAERFNALGVLPGESGVNLELLAQRLAVVGRIAQKRQASEPIRGVIIAPIQALMQSVPHPDTLDRFQLTIESGSRMPPAQLIDWLDRAGYNRVEAVEQPGDFATRGGIIDIFPPAGATGDDHGSVGPIRLDYFGDEIESVRRIDTSTMGSTGAIERVQIIGASVDQLHTDKDMTHLLAMLPDDTLVVLHEVMELAEQARGYFERLTNPVGIFPPQAVFQHLTRRPHFEVNQYSTAPADEKMLKLPCRSLLSFDHDASAAVKELVELVGGSSVAQVVVLCQNEAERDRLTELISEYAPLHRDAIDVEIGYLHLGFVWEEGGQSHCSTVFLVPHHELFHRYQTRRRIRKVSAAAGGRETDAFVELDVGDFVVHVEHGIARFAGIKTMTRRGRTEEYLTLEFAKNVLLHVPAAQINLVQRYVGGFSGTPPLSLMGGKRWDRQKQAAREAARDFAGEMLRVQAARASLPGVRYPPDTPWQGEFEAEFPYEETDDQLAAIASVKRDMSNEQPMDRLVCGDVGFGKTEVAIRAAFKAAEYGRQVAVLVPTTVLAEQHERTFRDRMADYPFRIESLSRFKTAKQQNHVLAAVARGQVDVVIGTHRLLSKDVKFADLGLVVIDEEQRFGIEHKQRLLQFRMTADVMTLTATPIPRTLHMAMLGLRDISSLSIPPLDRRAIVTDVAPHDKHRIQQAVIRELNRDGQVFFVHNRVYDIQSVADEIQKLVPEARVIVGHGQMSSGELEQVMLKFVRREADVLVCTTIIESGIDIPTANTIFIDNADHFGLADLHQLRGRVGRYKHRAYCYLLLPNDRPVTDTAARRLKAIEQYSMLGAGFKIAMRDLEIRGAGNLLGPQQSGHIAAVGYEMYCTLLEQEARRLKNDPIIEPSRTHLELPVSSRLTRKFIASDKYRMEAYRRLSRAATFDQLEAVVANLTDAYGQPPPQAQALINLAELRIAAGMHNIRSIKLKGRDLIFTTTNPRKLDELFKDAPGRVSLIDARTVFLRPPANYLEPPTLMAVLRKLLVRPLSSAGVAEV